MLRNFKISKHQKRNFKCFVERYMKYKTEFNILEFYIVCLYLTELLKDDTKIKCFRS